MKTMGKHRNRLPAFALAAVMLAAGALQSLPRAHADAVPPNPWNNCLVSANVYRNWDSVANKDPLLSSDHYWFTGSATTMKSKAEGGKFVVYEATTAANSVRLDGSWSATGPSAVGSLGFGFYFANNTSNAVTIQPISVPAGSASNRLELKNGGQAILVTSAGAISTVTATVAPLSGGAGYAFDIPAGWQGHILCPYEECLHYNDTAKTTTASPDPNDGGLNGYRFRPTFKSSVAFTTGTLVWDNVFMYGPSVTPTGESLLGLTGDEPHTPVANCPECTPALSVLPAATVSGAAYKTLIEPGQGGGTKVDFSRSLYGSTKFHTIDLTNIEMTDKDGIDILENAQTYGGTSIVVNRTQGAAEGQTDCSRAPEEGDTLIFRAGFSAACLSVGETHNGGDCVAQAQIKQDKTYKFWTGAWYEPAPPIGQEMTVSGVPAFVNPVSGNTAYGNGITVTFSNPSYTPAQYWANISLAGIELTDSDGFSTYMDGSVEKPILVNAQTCSADKIVINLADATQTYKPTTQSTRALQSGDILTFREGFQIKSESGNGGNTSLVFDPAAEIKHDVSFKWNGSAFVSYVPPVIEAFTPVLRFGVISDAHMREGDNTNVNRFKNAMNVLYGLADTSSYKTLDAVVMPGDFVEWGRAQDFEVFGNTIKDTNVVKPETRIIATLGNHEYYETPSGSQINALSVAQARLMQYAGLEIQEHAVVKGYSFITHPLQYIPGARWTGKYGIDWLETELAAANAASSSKPIFTAQHVPFKNTVTAYDYYFYERSDYGDNELYNLYAQYPQVVNFTGHTHQPLNVPNALHQGDFTSLSSGALTYIASSGSTANDSKVSVPTDSGMAQFTIVDVDAANTVRIRAYDLTNKRVINTWIIEDPSNKSAFQYTDARKDIDSPEFAGSASVTVGKTLSNSAQISFPAATDGDGIFRYFVQVRDVAANEIIRMQYVASDYWKLTPPTEFTVGVGGLQPSTAYEITVIAQDCYLNDSTNSLVASITTKAPLSTPWSNQNYKKFVYDDLSGQADRTLGLTDASTSPNYNASNAPNIDMAIRGGRLVVTKNSISWPVIRFNFGTGLSAAQTDGAEGLGFYFENNLAVNASIQAIFYGSSYFYNLPNMSVILVTLDGTETIVNADSGRTFIVPAGFKGYVVVPLDSMENTSNGSDLVPGVFSINELCIKLGTSFAEGAGTLVWGDYFIYGAELTVGAAIPAAFGMINALPVLNDLTLNHAAAVAAARDAYDALTDADMIAQVTNYSKLVAAEAKIADLQAVKIVFDMIAALPAASALTLADKAAAAAAETAFNALNSVRQAMVANSALLTSALSRIADLQTAQVVIDLIAALPALADLKLADKDAVAAARAAYNALAAGSKAIVIAANLSALTAAEAKIAELKEDGTTDDTTTPKHKGCGSAVTEGGGTGGGLYGGMAAFALLAAAVVVAKKRKRALN